MDNENQVNEYYCPLGIEGFKFKVLKTLDIPRLHAKPWSLGDAQQFSQKGRKGIR
jgi:hypothetical protein